jgi:NAD(P)-dependent dehydrogenase (short-subunit alcohol dehydrogenase family)
MRGIPGKVAIVVGGARGIGAATVREFVAEGARAVIADIDEAPARVLADELGAAVRFQRTDVTRDEDIGACVAAAVDSFGGIDFLVNLACTFADSGLQSSRQEWLASFDVNVVGHAILVREAVPHMRRRGGGAIVNASSIAAKFGQRGRLLYPVCKAAILQVTRNEAMELAADRIRVNAISPGWTWTTPLIALAQGDRARADRVAADYFPLGRVADASEVARAILFLCSDEASHITGIDLPIDGGFAITGADAGTPRMGRLAGD